MDAICINVDVSVFQERHSLLEAFLKTKGNNPIEIFGGECKEQANGVIQQYLKEKRLSLQHLTRTQKKDLVQHLYQKGIFNFKNTTPFIAKKLCSFRASIYNYIKCCPYFHLDG